jgi:DNA-directed RNA polymerase subunit RPC12/RpoP
MGQNVNPGASGRPLGQRPGPDPSVDYVCGNCGTLLLHAEDGLTHNLFILCTRCGAHNSTDAHAMAADGGNVIK